ncbi:hypothetical protein [Sporosarcina pasteurii]|uniref:Uncharacterized protein n=1 Tax=Sporosarcina pasteurii TaxID=1474 RepID=A0A380BD12_SPOPA|nr:hypothetical protein [Sporosarcina pasteurii]MDS9472563.1 hypothetical protein [Sporosarcina pasteurii]QBQ06116.1 hypothetical protein E2C16_10730 [Sporosarcina pasteurii]SUI99398.1 Uncharacterised protein [Sporosarcina pasteurii]
MVSIKQDGRINSRQLNDLDLVELAGFHAYKTVRENKYITVNDKKVKVVDVIADPETGLNAFTVQNTANGGYTVVYTGTNPKSKEDIITDLHLVNTTAPPQLEAGEEYLNDMEKKFGKIDSIAGNSLGGGVGVPTLELVLFLRVYVPTMECMSD